MLNFTPSSLIRRLSQFVSLTDCEVDSLHELERVSYQKDKGRTLIKIGDKNDKIMILKSGWAVVKSQSRDHEPQILRIYLAGELIGLAEIGSTRAAHQVVMQTDGAICELNRKEFQALSEQHPRLSALLVAIGSLDNLAITHHATCMRSMDAASNLKYFLLQLRSRLRVSKVGSGDRILVPFSQVEIGQAIGVTSIYVNKLLRAFVAEGQLAIDRPYFRLLERERWERESEYVDAYIDMDTSWFPPAQIAPDYQQFA